MSIFKDEMYKFITDEENFNLASEISELMPEVKERLINEFWDLVVKKLTQLDIKNEWDINYEENLFIDIYLKNKNWDCYFSLFDLKKNLFYGVYIDEGLDKSKGYKLLANTDFTLNMKKGSENSNWLYWKLQGENFNSSNTLKNIIPSKREDLVNIIATEYFDFINEGKELLIKLNK
ncbi:MAG: hypothetical protein A3K10_10950 [Bacteroidetes bacterium RIFCSPLOWO2_12_FULL_31_6]|nr:MAG: hypothetical protein A3K10_10950 [Bacteroidetes bacterium RIFCSPLOWO2_12_FULL_31_6]